jgi:hypothetical protein
MATPAEIKAAKIEEFKKAKASDAQKGAQKAKILARRDQLLANGYDPASAMQVAFDEVSGVGEFAKRVEAKKPKELPTPIAPGGRAPTAEELKTYREALKPAKPVKTEEELALEEGQRQTLRVDQQLKKTEAEWVMKRAAQIEASGFSPVISTQMAQEEFSKSFGAPQQAGFSGNTYKEKSDRTTFFPGVDLPAAAGPDYIPGSTASFLDALRPQVIYPTAEGFLKGEAKKTSPSEGALQTSASIIGGSIDWNAVKSSMEASGILGSKADDQIEALKAAYSKNLVAELSGIPNLAALSADEPRSKEFAERVYQRTIDELKGIDSVGNTLGAGPKITEKEGADAIAAALEPQKTSGGVPDYSPAQIEYLKTIGDRLKAAEKAARLGKETKAVYQLGDKIISEEEYKKVLAGAREDTDISVYKKLEVPKTEKDIDRELTQKYKTPWYLDEELKKEYLANPEAYKQEGFFADTDIYGGTSETTASWLLRSALILPNAVAGVVTPLLFEGTALTEEGRENRALIEEEKRKRRPEAYKDSPILYNISQNRGFTGEGIETADIMGLEGIQKGLYIAGTFGADLLDPTFDIAKGAFAGVKAAKNQYKAIGALGSLSPTQSARLKAAAKAGLTKGIDETIESSFLSLVGGKSRKLTETANARSLATATLSDSLDDAVKVEDQIRATADLASTDVKLGTSAYAKKFAEASAADKTAAQVREELSQAAKRAGDDALELAKDISVGIDEIITKGSTKLIRSKELGRQLGALSAVDDEVAATLKAVDDLKKTDRPKLQQYLEALEEGKKALLKRGLSQDLASTTIFKRTKDVSELENLVAATKNTFVNKASLPKIMEQVSASPIGRLSDALKKQKIIFAREDNQIIQAIKLEDSQADILKGIVLDLERANKLTPTDIQRINFSITNKRIGTKDFRALIDATVDLTAEGLVRATPSLNVTRGRDIARLSGAQQRAFLQPLESRSFTRQLISDGINKLLYKKDPSSKLSFGQQKIVQEATARLGNLDTKLRVVMKDLLAGDPALFSAYGIPAGKKLSREEALAYAIVGPDKNPDNIESILDFAINSIFYTKKTRQNLFDVFYGTIVSRDRDIFSAAGRREVDEAIAEAAKAIAANPADLWPQLKFITDDIVKPIIDNTKARPLSSDAYGLKEPNFAKDIINISEKGLPPEVALSLYFKAEADNIVNNTLERLVTEEVGLSRINITDSLSTDEFARIDNVFKNNEIGILSEIEQNIIKERLKKLLRYGRDSLKDPLTADEIDDMLIKEITRQDGKKVKITSSFIPSDEILKDPDILRDLNIVTEIANDAARSIARVNGLDSPVSMSFVEDTINNISQNTDVSTRLKAIYGEDAARELTEGLSEGFKDLRNELFNSVIRNVDTEDGIVKLKAVASKVIDLYNTAFYNLILTAAPRFHGGNIQTAAEIVYSTTGKLPNVIDVVNGAALSARSLKDPGGILLQKPTGFGEQVKAAGRSTSNPRFYTNREVYELLKFEGGRSLYASALPSVNTARALNLTDDKSYNRFTEGLRILGDTPQLEDMAFRYAIFADAIREGRSESEAIALARKAMYDASEVTGAEKKLQNLFLFYGWARNNFVNLVKNVASSEGRKRIIKALSANRSTEEILKDVYDVSDDEADFVKGRAPTQLILSKLPREPGSDKDIYNLSTRTTTAEAIKLFGDLVSQPSKTIQKQLTPGLKIALDVEDTFAKDKRMISPEHVWLAKEASDNQGADFITVLSTIIGGEIKPRKARPDEKSVDGYVYPLITESQRKRYEYFIRGLTLVGVNRIMSDYYKTISGQGTAARGATGALGTAAYGLAITNPMETVPAWKLELYNKYSKLAAIQGKAGYVSPSGVSALDQEFMKDVIEVDPADAARAKAAAATQKDFLEGAEELSQDIEEQTIYDMTVEELVAELSRPNLLRILRTKFKGDEDALDAYVEEIENRIDKLESESEALKKRK